MSQKCLRLEIHAELPLARAATLHLPHGPVRTPVFMPGRALAAPIVLSDGFVVGTKGTIKGVSSTQVCNTIFINNFEYNC